MINRTNISMGSKSLKNITVTFPIIKNKNKSKMKKKINIEDLNFATWLAITSEDFNSQEAYAAVVDYLNKFRTMGYKVYMSGTYRYKDSELRIIERIVAWTAQIIYAEDLIQKELKFFGKDAEPEMYFEQIDAAEEGLLKCRNQFPDFLKCFIEEDGAIYLRSSPYFIFEERLMYRTGLLLPDMEHSMEMAE